MSPLDNTCKTLDFICKFYWIFYVFTIPLFGIIFNVFYQVGPEGEASYIVQHPFMCLYPLPDYGRITAETCRREIIMKNALCSDVALCGLDGNCKQLPVAHTTRLVDPQWIVYNDRRYAQANTATTYKEIRILTECCILYVLHKFSRQYDVPVYCRNVL